MSKLSVMVNEMGKKSEVSEGGRRMGGSLGGLETVALHCVISVYAFNTLSPAVDSFPFNLRAQCCGCRILFA